MSARPGAGCVIAQPLELLGHRFSFPRDTRLLTPVREVTKLLGINLLQAHKVTLSQRFSVADLALFGPFLAVRLPNTTRSNALVEKGKIA